VNTIEPTAANVFTGASNKQKTLKTMFFTGASNKQKTLKTVTVFRKVKTQEKHNIMQTRTSHK